MKRLLSLILSVAIFLCSANIVGAEENESNMHCELKVEFSDSNGAIETLQVLVEDDNVYANAEELGKRLGYQVSVSDEYVSIYNKEKNETLPYGLTVFYYDSTRVSHMIFNQLVDYEAPFVIKKNEDGVWIPLEQSLLLLNSSMLIVEDTVLIDMPNKNIVDIYMDIMKENQKYHFDWTDDIGISEENTDTMGKASLVVSVLNGLLKKDGASWAQFVQGFALDSSAYDSKYGEEFAMLFCTYSDKELAAEVKSMRELMSHFNGSGTLGEMISELERQEEETIDALKETSKALKEKIDANNSFSIAAYNKSYQALENVCDEADVLSDATELYTKVGNEISSLTGFLDKFYMMAEVIGYATEFQKQDEFSVNALADFVKNSDTQSVMSKAMKEGIYNYTGILETDVATYSALRYLEENYDDLVFDAMDLSSALGVEATLMLIAWDLMSEKIPFYSEGLSETDDFMLSMYASVFQADAFGDYQSIRNSTFSNVESINAEQLYMVSEYCYTYLKSCYITREAALGALGDAKKEIPSIVDNQAKINEEIARYLIMMKSADTTNEKMCYGFLPEDNEEYLEGYDSSLLVELVDNIDPAAIAYNDFINNSSYKEYITEWEMPAETYCILDIDQNGVSELLIRMREDQFEEWDNVVIFSYDSNVNEVVYIGQICGWGGISYSGEYKALLSSEMAPSAMFAMSDFYGIEGMSLKRLLSVGHEMEMNSDNLYYFYMGEDMEQQVITEEEKEKYYENLIYPEFIQLPNNVQESTLEDLMNYLGSDLYEFVDSKHGFYDIGYSDGTIGYTNDTITVSTTPWGATIENEITDISIDGECNYCIAGIEYGMLISDAYSIVKQVYPESVVVDSQSDFYRFRLEDMKTYVVIRSYNNLTVDYIFVYKMIDD